MGYKDKDIALLKALMLIRSVYPRKTKRNTNRKDKEEYKKKQTVGALNSMQAKKACGSSEGVLLFPNALMWRREQPGLGVVGCRVQGIARFQNG